MTPTQPRLTIIKLALLDLGHEWILTLCMVLAIAAVLAPLLILLGLKHGTIQTMRERLIQDPVNREIRPARTLQLSEQWFQHLKTSPEVEFVIPTILRGSSIVRVLTPNQTKQLTLDLVPTAVNDPLILENEGTIPQEGESVLSYPAAEQLNIKPGTLLTIKVTRTRQGRRESVTTPLRVIAILNPRADPLPRLYAPSQFVKDVEAYREGLPVPQRQWPGKQAHPFLSYDGLWILIPQPLNRIQQRTLTINTGLVDIQTLTADQFQQQLGLTLPQGYTAYQLLAKGSPIQINSLKTIKDKLRGQSVILLPFAQNLKFKNNTGEPVKVIGLSLTKTQTTTLGWPTLPWEKFNAATNWARPGQILWPHNQSTQPQPIQLNIPLPQGNLQFPLINQGHSFSQHALVPAELIGILRTGQLRQITFNDTQQTFLLTKSGYRGFRLYARTIDDIPILYRWFIAQDIEVLTQIHEIEKIKVLDRGLTRIFWLIAIVGLLGGMAALIANLYAAVERKKRDISVLRLMGLSRRTVFQFPIYQGISIAVMSVIIAIGVYTLLSSIINLVFAADLKLGQKMCTLPESYLIMTLIITVGTAALSSLLAAWKTTRIDPAEAIREE